MLSALECPLLRLHKDLMPTLQLQLQASVILAPFGDFRVASDVDRIHQDDIQDRQWQCWTL